MRVAVLSALLILFGASAALAQRPVVALNSAVEEATSDASVSVDRAVRAASLPWPKPLEDECTSFTLTNGPVTPEVLDCLTRRSAAAIDSYFLLGTDAEGAHRRGEFTDLLNRLGDHSDPRARLLGTELKRLYIYRLGMYFHLRPADDTDGDNEARRARARHAREWLRDIARPSDSELLGILPKEIVTRLKPTNDPVELHLSVYEALNGPEMNNLIVQLAALGGVRLGREEDGKMAVAYLIYRQFPTDFPVTDYAWYSQLLLRDDIDDLEKSCEVMCEYLEKYPDRQKRNRELGRIVLARFTDGCLEDLTAMRLDKYEKGGFFTKMRLMHFALPEELSECAACHRFFFPDGQFLYPEFWGPPSAP